MNKYIVIKNWVTDFPNPLVLKSGTKVIVDNSIVENNPNWPKWRWSIVDGNAGWLPAQILDIEKSVSEQRSEALVLEDFSARELNVEIGVIVVGDRKLNGWLWCTKDDGKSGWVPLENLEIIS